MKSNVPLRACASGSIAAWVKSQASRAGTSCSQWIGTVLAEFHEDGTHTDKLRLDLAPFARQMTFVTCSIGGLLALHSDTALPEQMHAVFRVTVSVVESVESGL